MEGFPRQARINDCSTWGMTRKVDLNKLNFRLLMTETYSRSWFIQKKLDVQSWKIIEKFGGKEKDNIYAFEYPEKSL